MTYTIELTKAVAWPVLVLVLALTFGKPVRLLITDISKRLTKFSVGSTSIELMVREATKTIAQPVGEDVIVEPSRWAEQNLLVAQERPLSAVVAAYMHLDLTIREVARKLKLDDWKVYSASGLMRDIVYKANHIELSEWQRNLPKLMLRITIKTLESPLIVTVERAKSLTAAVDSWTEEIKDVFGLSSSQSGKPASKP